MIEELVYQIFSFDRLKAGFADRKTSRNRHFFLSHSLRDFDLRWIRYNLVAFQPMEHLHCGCSSVGRAPRCQRGCRRFESDHPLLFAIVCVGPRFIRGPRRLGPSVGQPCRSGLPDSRGEAADYSAHADRASESREFGRAIPDDGFRRPLRPPAAAIGRGVCRTPKFPRRTGNRAAQ